MTAPLLGSCDSVAAISAIATYVLPAPTSSPRIALPWPVSRFWRAAAVLSCSETMLGLTVESVAPCLSSDSNSLTLVKSGTGRDFPAQHGQLFAQRLFRSLPEFLESLCEDQLPAVQISDPP